MNPRERRQALQLMPYPLAIVGAPFDGTTVGAILANWIMQVSFDPVLLAVALERSSHMHEAVRASGAFSVNLLREGETDIARAFLRSPVSEGSMLNGYPFARATNGSPILQDAQASVACRVVQEMPAGDHAIFTGEIVEAVAREAAPVLMLRDSGLSYWREPK